MDYSPTETVSPQLLRNSMARRLHRRSEIAGELLLPAVPGMIDDYVSMCDTVFAAVGSKFTADELTALKAVLETQLADAFAASPRSNILISYNSPIGTTVNYHVQSKWLTVEAAYENWIATREPPLFGTEPDARIVALSTEAADPAHHRVLDIGAGTGRNALALARRGHPVDVVEMTPQFADVIRAEAERDGLDIRVITRDVFATLDDLQRDYQLILLSEVVSDFRTTHHLRALFQLAAVCLDPGGRLVFNAFLACDGFDPDNGVRELGQQMYSSIFTKQEMSAAAAQLPLALVSDDSVYEYEKAHLPDGAWPPTSWYAEWVSGQDVFDLPQAQCPIEMRWLVYEKTQWGV